MERTSQRYVPVALIVIAALLLAARIASYAAKEKGSDSLVEWMSIEEGMRAARESNKPILYDFTAEWCAPCHVLDEQVFRNPRLAAEINRRFVAVRVTDRQQEDGQNPRDVNELQQRYRVRAFPTVVFAAANGAELARMEGFPGRETFERTMGQVR